MFIISRNGILNIENLVSIEKCIHFSDRITVSVASHANNSVVHYTYELKSEETKEAALDYIKRQMLDNKKCIDISEYV